jgi:uncharacterized membrane protein
MEVPMSRDRYVLLIPLAVLSVVVLGFIISLLVPSLGPEFYLILAASAGLIIVLLDRVLRARLDEPTSDERIDSIVHQASYLSFRISFSLLVTGGIVLMFVLPDESQVRFVGMGLWIAMVLQSVLYGASYFVLRRRQ